jgi:hypothetical protein
MKKTLLTSFVAALALQASAQTYTPVTLTGFNADIIANGSGSATASTTHGVDNSDFAFVAQNFVNPTNQSPAAAGSLPNSGLITSAMTTTPGLPFQLASYTGNNALRLAAGTSGTLTFSTPGAANDVYVLLTPAAYSGTCPTTITVNFTDNTTQVFSGIVLNNWFGSNAAAYSGTDRVNRVTNAIDVQTTGPKIFQQKLTLSAANTSKLIQSILVNNNSAVSTTNVLVVLAATTSTTFANDAGVTAVSGPNTGCVLTTLETINITVKNYGTTPQTNVPVSYKINTGTPVNEVIAGPIAAGATVTYPFTTKANLSAVGAYSIEARTSLVGDQAATNDITTRSITLSAAPAMPTVTAGGATTFCSGSTLTLTAASATTGVTYQWFKNGTAIASATNATYSANAAGNYTVVAAQNGCASAASAATALTVNNTPVAPTVTLTGLATFCTGGSATLTAASTAPGATFTWYNNGTAIAGATAATYTATTAGSYTAKATAGICTGPASTARAITVKALPATPTISKNGNVLTSSSTSSNQWYKNGTAITGATAATYTTTTNGAYTVVVTTNGCASTASNAVNVTTLGISADKNNLDVSVFPNPSTGLFNLTLPEGQAYQLIVTDLTGKVIQHETIGSKAARIDLSKEAKGVYMLKIVSENKIATRKLVIE